MKKITYAGIVPLIGGMMFGAQKATGKKPEYILSYPAFGGNDSLLTDYWKDVPYHNIEPESNRLPENLNLPRVDFVSALCPCAGLSQLNNGKKRGADAPQNDWMYKTAEHVLESIQPTVFWGENAPGLFSTIGVPVAAKLREIGEKNGYSMSLLKTTTMLHGIPQNRVRSFYFFWRSEVAPVLTWINKERPSLENYLSNLEIPKDEIAEKTLELQSDPLYIWLKKEYTDWRDFMRQQKGSMLDVIISSGRAPEYIEWAKEHYPDHVKKAEHAYFKRSNGMGFWDSSPFLPTDYTGAFTGARMNAIHPIEDRVFTRKELMHFMGLPHDMTVPSNDQMGKVFQNVPSSTAADWTLEVIKFINGELPKSEHSFIKQDNITQRIEVPKSTKAFELF